jgi:Leucine-rich repeat (LRR) protein
MKSIAAFILLASIVGAIADKEITCIVSGVRCTFRGVTIGKDENVSIRTSSNVDDHSITEVFFEGSSVYAIPPEIFYKFPVVKLLFMEDQKVQQIRPRTFLYARYLERLMLWGSNLGLIYNNNFEGATNLNHLSLSKTGTKTIEVDAFKGLKNLSFLSFGVNPLQTVHKDILRDLPNLTELSVYNTPIQTFPKDFLKNNLQLKLFWAQGNKIFTLDRRMFSHLKSLIKLDLSGSHCVDKYYENFSLATLENELMICQNNLEVERRINELKKYFVNLKFETS